MDVVVPKYTREWRALREAITYTRGLDVEHAYLVQGVLRTDVGAMLVDLIVDVPAQPLATPAIARGHNWFVRAGSTESDGTRNRPFHDVFQALEKAEGGDTIHVAGGHYFGKLRCGRWNIAVHNLTLLGGYDTNFQTRDPWLNHTLFCLDPEKKAGGGLDGTILYSQAPARRLLRTTLFFSQLTPRIAPARARPVRAAA